MEKGATRFDKLCHRLFSANGNGTDYLSRRTGVKCGYLPGERPLPTVHEAYIGDDGEWHSSVVYGVENADVTHWMLMPEPPKEDAK